MSNLTLNLNEEKVIARSELPTRVEEICANLLDKMNPLQAYVKLHNLKMLTTALMERLREEALHNLGEREEEVYGAKVTRQQKARTYDYGNDGQMKALIKLADDAAKALQSWQAIRRMQKTELIDPRTGEVLPPPKVLTDGVTIRVEPPV